MNRYTWITTATAFAAIAACLGGDARGELIIEEPATDGGQLVVYKMTVTPAAAPDPALRHRLLPAEADLKRGNAAPFYYRAMMSSGSVDKSLRDKFGGVYEDWWSSDTPLAKLPLPNVREAAIAWDPVVKQLREAAVRRDCEWGWQLEQVRGPELLSFVLPEIQESRQLSRALMLQTRLAIAEGRIDDALDALRINYKMSRDVAAEPLLVCGLVGVAEASIGNVAVLELCAAKNSPNLYWALAELPQPLVDLRPAVRFEMSGGLRVFPFMLEAESADHSPDEWARLLAEALSQLQSANSGGAFGDGTNITDRMAAAAFATASYGPAKQRLIASGMDADAVERMPVGQVIAIDAAREYRRVADEFEKWWYVPYSAAGRITAVEKQFQSPKLDAGYGGLIAQLLVPALSSARTAQQRLQWQLGAVQTVEAIRMHAAETGKLPASLDDVKVVPVPENPATGRPYQYQLENGAGVLELPFSDGFPGVARRIEITLAE